MSEELLDMEAVKFALGQIIKNMNKTAEALNLIRDICNDFNSKLEDLDVWKQTVDKKLEDLTHRRV